MSAGLRMTASAENSTLPRALRSALSRSNTCALRRSSGSTSKNAVPVSRSYGPVDPKEAPSATTSVVLMTSRVRRASLGGIAATVASAPIARVVGSLRVMLSSLALRRADRGGSDAGSAVSRPFVHLRYHYTQLLRASYAKRTTERRKSVLQ